MENKFDFSTIIDDWKKMFTIIVLSSLILAMLGDLFIYRTRDLIYRSEATLQVSAKKGDTRYSMYTNLNVTQQMAKTLSYIMNSDIIEDLVEEDLGVNKLNGRIQTSVTKDTNFIVLRVFGDTPKDTFDVMHSVLNHYQDLCEEVMPGAYVEILSMPLVPISPSNPVSHGYNVMSIFALSFAALSFAICFYSYKKDTIKNSKDISEKIDAPLFASVPYQKVNKDQRILVTDVKTGFSYVEAFKRMRVKIESSGHQVIMVTSALPNEGKSTVSANLALTLAKNKKNVLLMDLDLRNPSIAHLFNYQVEHEILEVFKGETKLNDALTYDESFKMFYLLGKETSTQAPEILGSPIMKQSLEVLRKYFDYIIIDTPPARYLSDALVVSELCDASIFVVKQNNATSKMINDTIDMIKESNPNMLGCVFNHSVKNQFGSSGHYGYYGGYHGYYGYKKYGYGKYKYGYGEYGKNERKSEK